uniref:L1 transposable element RRM domain-containing protein n=1 Tax=Latimeria chalumnae TaxID=7897 RepID=H3AJF9_LATCH
LDFYRDSGAPAELLESVRADSQVAAGKRGSLVEEMHLGFNSIQAGLSGLHSEVASLNNKLDGILHRLDASERRIGDIEDWMDNVENVLSEVHQLREKCDDLENRARRLNLRIVGLPEGIEGRDPISFLEKLLVEVLGEGTFPGRVEIERAHRALRPRPKEGEKPCIMIFKLLRFLDKVCILRRARELGQLTFKNQKIFFFPDISAELQARRHEFTEALRLCHSLHLPFSLLHPARLRVSLQEGPRFFVDPEEAVEFLKQLPDPPSTLNTEA